MRAIHSGYMKALGRRCPRAAENAPRDARDPGLVRTLVHDWLTGMRGGEKVLLSLARLFPEAPIFTLLHVRGLGGPRAGGAGDPHHVRPAPSRRGAALPPLPAALPGRGRNHDLSGFDLVVSSSHCVAKGVRPSPRALHLCYCHTPMRYVWDRYEDYFGPGRVSRLAGPPYRSAVRRDCGPGTPPPPRGSTAFVANSAYVAGRIRRYYGRDAEVIPPPVDTDFFTPGRRRPGRLSTLWSPRSRPTSASSSRSRPTAARAGRSESSAPVRRESGSARAPPEAELPGLGGRRGAPRPLSRVPRGAHAGVEDFGIVPLEAMACGRPAIVFGEGGGRESRPARADRALFTGPRRRPSGPPLTRWRPWVLIASRFEPKPRRTAADVRGRFRAFVERALARMERRNRMTPDMLKFQTRMMVVTFVLLDVAATVLAWLLAYFLRFHSALCRFLPVTKGVPDLSATCSRFRSSPALAGGDVLPRPLPLKRGRSRIDEFFAILFSVLVATGLTLAPPSTSGSTTVSSPRSPRSGSTARPSSHLRRARRDPAQPRPLRAPPIHGASCGRRATTCGGCWWRARESSAARSRKP